MTSTISDNTGENRPTFVVGAAGRLGQMLVAHWPESADFRGSARGEIPNFIQLDLILDPVGAANAMAGAGAVICLAGITPAQAATGSDGFSRNSDLAVAAVQAAHSAGAGRVFVTSSAAVYGAAGGVLDEDAEAKPVSEYGIAKLRMEQDAIAQGTSLGQPVTALRIGNVAGADAILGGWRDGFTLDQLPDGRTPKRSYIGPQSLARVLHALTRTDDLPDVLNIAAPGAVQMGALLDAGGLPWVARPAPETVIADVTLCTKRLQAIARFDPQDSTPAGLVAEWRAFQTLQKATL